MATRGTCAATGDAGDRFIRDGSSESNARWLAGFHKGLSETGYVEGQNVTIEYHWLEGKYDHLPEVLADLVRRQVAMIASLGTLPTQAAKAGNGGNTGAISSKSLLVQPLHGRWRLAQTGRHF